MIYSKRSNQLSMKKSLSKKACGVTVEKKHEGKWVAISSDYSKVLDYSDDVVKLVERNGRENVMYTKILRSDVSYIF